MSKFKRLMGIDFKSNRDKIFYIVMTAFLIALYVAIDKGLTVIVSPVLKTVSLNFVPIIVAAMLLGPVSSAAVFCLGDVIGSTVFPTGGAPFYLLWVTYFVMGFVYGLFMYCPFVKSGIYEVKLIKNEKLNKLANIAYFVLMVFIALVIVKLVISLFVNTYIIGWYLDKATALQYLKANLLLRLPKNLIDIAIILVVAPLLAPVVKKIKKVK